MLSYSHASRLIAMPLAAMAIVGCSTSADLGSLETEMSTQGAIDEELRARIVALEDVLRAQEAGTDPGVAAVTGNAIDALRASLSALEDQIAELESAIATETVSRGEEIRSVEGLVATLQSEIAGLRSAIGAAEKDIAFLTTQRARLSEDLDVLEKRFEDHQRSHA